MIKYKYYNLSGYRYILIIFYYRIHHIIVTARFILNISILVFSYDNDNSNYYDVFRNKFILPANLNVFN